MMGRSAFICACQTAALLEVVPSIAPAAARPIALTHCRMLARIASPRFSPDGWQIAFLTARLTSFTIATRRRCASFRSTSGGARSWVAARLGLR
jgi:hypothetical protein